MDFLNRDWSVFLDIGFFLLYRDFHYYRKNAAEIFLFTERLPPRAGSLRNLCVVREIPSFYTTANYLRCSSKPHDFQGKSQAGLTGPA